MIAVNQVVVTAPALRADIANACSSFDHLGRTGEQCRACGQAAPVPIIETDKATGDKDPYDRDGSCATLRQAGDLGLSGSTGPALDAQMPSSR
jgi:hypothetical protein